MEEDVVRLTSGALMQLTLADFNIKAPLPMAEAIYNNFMQSLTKAGYAEWIEGK